MPEARIATLLNELFAGRHCFQYAKDTSPNDQRQVDLDFAESKYACFEPFV